MLIEKSNLPYLKGKRYATSVDMDQWIDFINSSIMWKLGSSNLRNLKLNNYQKNQDHCLDSTCKFLSQLIEIQFFVYGSKEYLFYIQAVTSTKKSVTVKQFLKFLNNIWCNSNPLPDTVLKKNNGYIIDIHSIGNNVFHIFVK